MSSASRRGPAAASSAASVARAMSGTSPYSTSTMWSSGMPGSACATACPVPSRSACSVQATLSPASAARTASPPWPYTTCSVAGTRLRAVSMTCFSSGRPASGCSTLGSAERMRLPSPAARITTDSGAAAARAGAAPERRRRGDGVRRLGMEADCTQRCTVNEARSRAAPSTSASFFSMRGPTYSCGLEWISCAAVSRCAMRPAAFW